MTYEIEDLAPKKDGWDLETKIKFFARQLGLLDRDLKLGDSSTALKRVQNMEKEYNELVSRIAVIDRGGE